MKSVTFLAGVLFLAFSGWRRVLGKLSFLLSWAAASPARSEGSNVCECRLLGVLLSFGSFFSTRSGSLFFPFASAPGVFALFNKAWLDFSFYSSILLSILIFFMAGEAPEAGRPSACSTVFPLLSS